MPTIPAVGSAVVIADDTSEYRGLHGEVTALHAQDTYNTASATVALWPRGLTTGDVATARNKKRFRNTQLKVTSGGTPDQAVDKGNKSEAAIQNIKAGSAVYTPKPSTRRDTLGGGYNGIEPQATLG